MIKTIFAVSVALKFENKNLWAKRTARNAEFPSFWSLPSTGISEIAHSKILETSSVDRWHLQTLIEKCFVGDIDFNSLHLARRGLRHRGDYLLDMLLVTGEVQKIPSISEKYETVRPLDIKTAIEENGGRMGTCGSLLIENDVELGAIESTIRFLEIPPEWASSNLESMSDEVLWHHAAKNYSLLKKNRTGSDGLQIRSATLDRYLMNYVRRIPTKSAILDLGCGDGSFVKLLRQSGHDVQGLDIEPLPANLSQNLADAVNQGNGLQASRLYPERHFDYIFATLIVQWVSDLAGLVSEVYAILKNRGKFLISVVPPEFSKNGKWVSDPTGYRWVIDTPLRSTPRLTMINRSVGPVRYYPRSTAQLIDTVCSIGLVCIAAENLFIDSFLSESEWEDLLLSNPTLIRHQMLPVFTILEFANPSNASIANSRLES